MKNHHVDAIVGVMFFALAFVFMLGAFASFGYLIGAF